MRIHKKLPYGRNPDKRDLTTVFTDGCGTCSTKHALLRQLAVENNATQVQLMLGVFRMSAQNTPAVRSTLAQYGLDYIPEAHNYLKVDGEIVDCTNAKSSEADFIDDLMIEIEIQPEQITDFKVTYHQTILKNWLADHPHLTLNFDALWMIRERCIADLSRSNS